MAAQELKGESEGERSNEKAPAAKSGKFEGSANPRERERERERKIAAPFSRRLIWISFYLAGIDR